MKDNFEEVLEDLHMLEIKLRVESQSARDIEVAKKLRKLITECNSLAFGYNTTYKEKYGA